MTKFISLIFSLLFLSVVHANDLPTGFNFDGVLLDGSNVPITVSSALTLQIYDPGTVCLLYEETQNVTPDSQGNFSIKVGSQTGDPKRTVNDPALNWALIFQNITQIRAAGTNCVAGYTPATGDNRFVRLIVNATPLTPDFSINSVPAATVAETLNGKVATDFVQRTVASVMSANLTFANGNSLRFRDNTTNTLGFTAPASVTTTTWTLPSADGTANQCLSTNGSGTLSWFTPTLPTSGGTISSGGLTVSGAATIATSTSAAAAMSSTTTSTSGVAVNGLASAATGATIGGQFQSNSTTGTALVARAGNAATKGLVIEGAAGQTANLTEWKVNGTIVSVVNAAGSVGIGTPTPNSALEVNGAITTRGMSAPSVSATGQGRLYFDSTSATYKVSQSGGAYKNIVGAAATANANALTNITADFSSSNMVRATGAAAACGTLNFTNVSSGETYSVTIVNATAVCTTVQLNGSSAAVKLPPTYSAGAAAAGVVYSAMYDGSTLWVSYVPF